MPPRRYNKQRLHEVVLLVNTQFSQQEDAQMANNLRRDFYSWTAGRERPHVSMPLHRRYCTEEINSVTVNICITGPGAATRAR